MATLTLRSTKGTPLTNNEIDSNFTSLDADIQTRVLIPGTDGITINEGGTTLTRSIAVSGTGLSVTNADGVSGNPTISSNATNANTASTIVSRDASGNFSAGTLSITAATATGTISANALSSTTSLSVGTSISAASASIPTIGSTTITATTVTSTDFNGALYIPSNKTIVYEGALEDAFETTLTLVNPTADRTITFPDITGTVVTTGDTGTITNTMLAGSIANDKLAGSITNDKLVNSSITFAGNLIALGGSLTFTDLNTTWTGMQTFRDNKFTLTDNVDTSKTAVFEVGSIPAATSITLTIPTSSGTIATQAYVTNQLAGFIAPGLVLYFPGSTVPSGWLKCNGADVSRSTYSLLFGAIGTTWGAGDGSTTFTLPDLRGEFLRVWDDGRGVDTGRAINTSQAQQTDAVVTVESASSTGNALITIPDDGTNSLYISTGSGTGRSLRFRRSAVENRPRNIALMACIKT